MQSDDDLRSEIHLELLRQFSTNAQSVEIQVLDGVVTLTGRVASDADRWRLKDTIHAMTDVRELIDDTLVVPEAPSVGPSADTAKPWFPGG